ncbi:MAG TPA: M1 family aminopeptidase [Steroidobacteraceae bacterium]|jgi:ABC-type transport system involved in multi-copper enzyme maturation permease subunit
MYVLTIAAFELRSRLKLISTWVYWLLYAALGGLWMAAAGGAIEHAMLAVGSEKLHINSPYPLAVAITVLGFTGVIVIAAMMGRAVQQDFEYGTFHFVFTAPIRKSDYFLGRFLGAFLALMVIFTGIAVGLEIGMHLPGVEAARVAPFTAQSVLRPYLYNVIPNTLWLGGVFFVIAALTRAMAPVYIGSVLVLIGYLLAGNLLDDMENRTLAAMVDPMGTTALDVLTRYWSVAEKNTRQISLGGVLLWNRLLWVSFGLIATAVGYRLFRMDYGAAAAARRSRRGKQAPLPAAHSDEVGSLVAPERLATAGTATGALDRTPGAYLRALPTIVWLYLRETIRSPRFYTVVAGGAVFIVGSARDLGSVYGTSTWPVTYQVLQVTSSFFSLFILIITAIHAGELVWRERDTRIDEIVDSTPVPGWLGFFAKLLTLFAIQAVLLAVVMVCSIGIQLWQGYTRLEIGHYLFELYVLQWPLYWLLAALALTIHVLVNQKYLAHFVVVVFFLLSLRLPDFGLEDRLYRFGSVPAVMYSDMNGYGHFLPAMRWFELYWSAAAVLLLVLTNLMWVRGRETTLRARLRAVRPRFGRAALVVSMAAAAVLIGSGTWIFYNTHVLNPFFSKFAREELQARYEQRYKSLQSAPQPKIAAIDLHADLFPHQHRAHLSGTMTLQNRSGQPVSELYVMLPRTADVQSMDFGIASKLMDFDRDLGWRHYRLNSPLQPGASSIGHFEVGYAMKGFTNDGAERVVVDNGTFLNGAIGPDTTFVPSFGYSEDVELTSDRERRKFGLAPKERAHDLDDPVWRQIGFIRDADWIDYSATVSTVAGQLPVTSGYVERQWTENGRTYVRYRMDSKMADTYPLMSARYQVRRDRWGEAEHAVSIEIDYQAGHEFNLDRMIAGVKDSLSYFTQNYGPYQHHILRIIEFPRYERFAESFPNTVPFSEAIGFVAKVDDADPKDIDYPYFVTAHEVAHQWWGHQVTPASVQGGDFLSESLAEYSALMVLKHRYGDAKMRRFLRYELDRYLLGRSTEGKKEQPLYRADGPTYLHYQKGSLALYAMQDAIGEATLNQALAAFVADWRMKGPPYPTSRELLAKIRAVTPPQQQYLITDLFESIVLFDNRTTAATWRALAAGQFEVDLTVSAKKSRADGLGNETEVPMDEDIDVGVFDSSDKPLLLRKMRIHSGIQNLRLVVDAEPAKAGIDPLNKLIDRSPEDNTRPVSRQ